MAVITGDRGPRAAVASSSICRAQYIYSDLSGTRGNVSTDCSSFGDNCTAQGGLCCLSQMWHGERRRRRKEEKGGERRRKEKGERRRGGAARVRRAWQSSAAVAVVSSATNRWPQNYSIQILHWAILSLVLYHTIRYYNMLYYTTL